MTVHFVTYRPNRDRDYPDQTDRYENFMSGAPYEALEGWSSNKTFEPGDLAVFYMARPLASLVGAGVVDSDPYVIEDDRTGDFSNQVYCDFRPMWFLDNPVPIKEAVGNQNLHDWWKTTPYQSIRRMPDEVAEALIEEMVRLNSPAPRWLKRWEPIVDQQPLVISTRKARIPKPPEKLDSWKLQQLRTLGWRAFEELVAKLFANIHKDAEVELTPGSKDKGVDIYLRYPKTGDVEIVQCKRYRAGVKVSSPDMQKFAGAMLKSKAKKGSFVTTSDFNGFAKDFADGLSIDLITGRKVTKMLNASLDLT